MKKLILKRTEKNRSDYMAKPVSLEHVSRVYEETDCVISDSETPDEPMIVLKSNHTFDDLYEMLVSAPNSFWHGARRANGNFSSSRTYGFQPRAPLRRRNYCCAARANLERPDIMERILDWVQAAEKDYADWAPAKYHKHKGLAEQVLPAWRMRQTAFTSGIINHSTALGYHTDTGNIKECWSMMLVLRKGVEGGQLVLPEYDCALSLPHGSQLFFDGQGLIHGVAPIRQIRKGGKRFSIVAYTLSGMLACLEPAEELKHGQVQAMMAEKKREEMRKAKATEIK